MSFVEEPDTFYSKHDGEMLWEGECDDEEADAKVIALQPKAVGYCRGPEGQVRIFARGSAKGRAPGWVTHTYKPDVSTGRRAVLYLDDFSETEAAGAHDCDGWKRPGRKMGLHDNEHLAVFSTVSPNDLDQGGLGDCWLISALSTLAEYPSVVMSLIEQQDIPGDGKFVVNLYSFRERRMVKIEVDDRLPTKAYDCAYVHISHDGEMWPCIMEKAFAKLCGGYEKLDGGHSGFALAAMLGHPDVVMYWKPKEDEDLWVETPGAWSDNDVQNVQWLGGGRQLRGQQMFDILAQYDSKNYPMCCSSHSGSDSDTNDQGIVQGHAYSLLQVKKNVCGKNFDLLQVRNPWGNSEWTGDWGDDSALWEENRDVQEACGMIPQDDGLFWIDWEDFNNNYKKVWVCRKELPKNRGKRLAARVQEQGLANMLSSEPLMQSYGLSFKKGAFHNLRKALGC